MLQPVMDLPAFAKRRPEMWSRHGRTLVGTLDEVTFTAEAPWLGGRWVLSGASTLVLPELVTAYVSKTGSAHGYFANAPIGLAGYFSYGDPPALMPVVVGARTRRAVVEHDRIETRQPVVLHIHDRKIETVARVDAEDDGALDAQLAIHEAVAADQDRVLDAWKEVAEELGGVLTTAWPPHVHVPRGFGAVEIALRWPPSTHASSQAVIEFLADARKAPLWSVEREPQPTPASVEIAHWPFLVMGTVPMAMERLARVVELADVLSINVRRNITVRIAGVSPNAAIFEAVLELIGELCGPPPEPYR